MKHQAVYNTHPEVKSIDGSDPDNLICIDVNGGIVTDIDYSKVDTEEAKLQAEEDAQVYARNRAAEYPSTGDQLDMMYKDTKNSTTTHADAVEAVKTKWPKDNSGPVE